MRVVPGVAATMARSTPIALLRNVDLPTFGRPITATVPERVATLPSTTGVRFDRGDDFLG